LYIFVIGFSDSTAEELVQLQRLLCGKDATERLKLLIADVHFKEMVGMEEARRSIRSSVDMSCALNARRLTMSAPLTKPPSPPVTPPGRLSMELSRFPPGVLAVSENCDLLDERVQQQQDGNAEPDNEMAEVLLSSGSPNGPLGTDEPKYAQAPAAPVHVRPEGVAVHAMQI